MIIILRNDQASDLVLLRLFYFDFNLEKSDTYIKIIHVEESAPLWFLSKRRL